MSDDAPFNVAGVSRWIIHPLIALLALGALPAGGVPARSQAPTPGAPTEQSRQAKQPDTPPNAPIEKMAPPSKAEQIVKLEAAFEKDRNQLAELADKLKAHEQGEYAQAKEARKQLLTRQDTLATQLAEARQRGDAGELQRIEEEQKKLQEQLPLAKERLDLAQAELDNRQTLIDTLNKKVTAGEAELNRLQGKPDATAAPEPGPAQPAPATEKPKTEPPAAAEPTQSSAQTPANGLLPGIATAPKQEKPPEGAPAPPKTEEQKKRAKEIAQQQVVVQEAEQKLEDVQRRFEALTAQKKAIREGLDLARRRMKNLVERRDNVENQLKSLEPGSFAYRELQEEARELQEQLGQAEQEVANRKRQLNDLQQQFAGVKEAKASANKEFEEKRTTLQDLESPFSLRNVQEWLLTSGPRVLVYIFGVLLLLVLIKFIARRISKAVSADDEHGTRKDREHRAHTLVSVFQNTATLAVVVVGVSMILQEFGISLAAFVGVAAIATLAVGFASQSIVKDYFHGFLILLENQYTVDDVVKVAGIAGLVERITLRVTTLRDLEGVVHFVPNGQITTVSNMTHQWSRALFEVGVSYNEDLDRVMDVLMELGREMRKDKKFSRLILDDPEMLGVDGFGDSAITVKFFIKTHPLQQWTVKREFNRRMKRKFDELGIEIPFPHRTLYHRVERDHEEAEALGGALLGLSVDGTAHREEPADQRVVSSRNQHGRE